MRLQIKILGKLPYLLAKHREIELCDKNSRVYQGFVASKSLMQIRSYRFVDITSVSGDLNALPPLKTMRRLDLLATSDLLDYKV